MQNEVNKFLQKKIDDSGFTEIINLVQAPLTNEKNHHIYFLQQFPRSPGKHEAIKRRLIFVYKEARALMSRPLS